jgi:hypothetical protein
MRKVVPVLLGSLVVFSVCALAVEEAQGTPDLELLKRLLSVPGTSQQVVEVTLGSLPSGWPQDIPIPQEAEIIGGIALSDGSITLRFDISWALEAVPAAYGSLLAAEGWSQARETLISPFSLGALFCRGSETLLVVAGAEEDTTVVELNYMPSNPLCPWEERDVSPGVLPHFVHRAGVRGTSQGTDSSGGQWIMSTLVTTLAPAELEAHYRAQFMDAEWEVVDHGVAGPVAWGRHRKSDEQGDWEACLVIVELAIPTERYFVAIARRLGW